MRRTPTSLGLPGPPPPSPPDGGTSSRRRRGRAVSWPAPLCQAADRPLARGKGGIGDVTGPVRRFISRAGIRARTSSTQARCESVDVIGCVPFLGAAVGPRYRAPAYARRPDVDPGLISFLRVLRMTCPMRCSPPNSNASSKRSSTDSALVSSSDSDCVTDASIVPSRWARRGTAGNQVAACARCLARAPSRACRDLRWQTRIGGE